MRKTSAQSKTSTSRNSRDSWFEERLRNAPVSTFKVPPAVRRTKMRAVDKMFEKMKAFLEERLPLYSLDEIAKFRLPHYVIFLQQLHDTGYEEVVGELRDIVAKEQQDVADDQEFYVPLLHDKDRLEYLADQLLESADLVRSGHVLRAIEVRKRFAEEILLAKRTTEAWLSKHLYQTCIQLADKIADKDQSLHLKCEVHCILGYLELEQGRQGRLQAAMADLEASRKESKDKDWIVQTPVICLKIKKPINLYGLREDYEEMCGRSMTLHSVVTLLMYEALSSKVCELIFNTSTTRADLSAAQLYAEDALKMALESRQWIAMSSGYLLVGVIFLKKGDYDVALHHFSHYLDRTSLRCDFESEAIAFNMLGCCYLGKHDPINALECFAWEKEIAESHDLKDLLIDGLQNIAQVLIAEGQTVEAEACCFLINENIKELQNPVMNLMNLVNNSWARFGLSAGLNTWSRLAAHCRLAGGDNLKHVTKWKGFRLLMPKVDRVATTLPLFTDVFPDLDPKSPISTTDSEVWRFFLTNKKFLDGVSNQGVPFGEESSVHFWLSHKDDRQWKRRGRFSRSCSFISGRHNNDEDSDISTVRYESDRRYRPRVVTSKTKKLFTAAIASARFRSYLTGGQNSDDTLDTASVVTTQSDNEGEFEENNVGESSRKTVWTEEMILGLRRSTHGGVTLANSVAKARDELYEQTSFESMAKLNKTGVEGILPPVSGKKAIGALARGIFDQLYAERHQPLIDTLLKRLDSTDLTDEEVLWKHGNPEWSRGGELSNRDLRLKIMTTFGKKGPIKPWPSVWTRFPRRLPLPETSKPLTFGALV